MNFWWRWLILWLILGFGLRCFMLVAYPAGAPPIGLGEFLFGMLNDLQSFLILAGLVAGLGLFNQRVLRGAAYVFMAVTLVVFTAEVFFWLEFESRLDRLVFHYLAYPKEVLVFLEDQFFLSLFVLPLLLLTWALMRLVSWPQRSPDSTAVQLGFMGVGVVLLLAAQPLGQSASRVTSEFVSNGYLGVLADARFAEDDIAWLAEAATPTGQTQPVALTRHQALDTLRRELGAKRHVVLIIEESFAGPVWEDPLQRQHYLPNFAALAEDSVNFTNLYASGSRTTRGLEALLNGFPPLPGISTTQRENFDRLPSLARAMQDGGFYPVFLYGGWPGFSNFHNYWQAMGFRKLWSREDFAGEFETSWGVADGALFERLVAEMDVLSQQHDRVFLATLTVSHHRPYDFPAGSVPFPSSARRSEYAMAYADHALGELFDAARATEWYDDTLFVIAADHGLYPRGDALIPVNSYHIPMIFHGQGIPARRFSKLGSSVSLPKTLMNLFGIETAEAFAGDDLLCDCDTVVPVEAGYHVGLLERGRLHIVTQEGAYSAWNFDPGTRQLTHVPMAAGTSVQHRQRVIDVFAPAYQWFYEVPQAQANLARVHHADVAGE